MYAELKQIVRIAYIYIYATYELCRRDSSCIRSVHYGMNYPAGMLRFKILQSVEDGVSDRYDKIGFVCVEKQLHSHHKHLLLTTVRKMCVLIAFLGFAGVSNRFMFTPGDVKGTGVLYIPGTRYRYIYILI